MAKKTNKIEYGVDRLNNPVILFTDGSCFPNPGGPGGWGCVIKKDGQLVKELHGGEYPSTNNRMEMMAVISGLEYILKEMPEEKEVNVLSDSQYVVNTICCGWNRGKNRDLWKKIDSLIGQLKCGYTWVRGHNGLEENERCDELANIGRSECEVEESNRSIINNKKFGAMDEKIDVPDRFLTTLWSERPESINEYVEKYEINKECASAIKKFYETENRNFKAYAALKTYGRDKYSSIKSDQMKEIASGLYEWVNEQFGQVAHTESVFRWIMRGLDVKDAIRKEFVSIEISKNAMDRTMSR